MKIKIHLIALFAALPLITSANDDDKKLTLFDDFTEASVIFKSGETQHALLNYDTSSEKFLFMSDGEVMELTNTADIVFINVKGRLFENARGGFYEKISTGTPTDLYVLWRTKVESRGKTGAYGSVSKTSNISDAGSVGDGGSRITKLKSAEILSAEPNNTYFIKVNSNFKAFFSEKTLLKLFKGKESQVKEFIKSNGTDFQNVEDVKALIAHLSQFLS